MLFGMFFAFWRFCEIVTLIPTLGMLAYFVHIYVSNNALTPNYILVLFIVSVLACAWAIATLFTYHRTRNHALFVSFIDLCLFGALIAGVYELRFITNSNCAAVNTTSWYYINFGSWGDANIDGLSVRVDKTCAMLKSCFAFAIMNCIFFFITSLLACMVGRGHERERYGRGGRDDKVYTRETHVSRHGHRRSGSHRSRRSSHRRSYV